MKARILAALVMLEGCVSTSHGIHRQGLPNPYFSMVNQPSCLLFERSLTDMSIFVVYKDTACTEPLFRIVITHAEQKAPSPPAGATSVPCANAPDCVRYTWVEERGAFEYLTLFHTRRILRLSIFANHVPTAEREGTLALMDGVRYDPREY